MTVSNSREKALKLVRLGLPVFKVRLGADGTKTPIDKDGHGHLEASVDPGLVDDWFTENKSAHVGVHVGPANLIVLDIDVKNGKNGWDSLEENWYTIPNTWGYDTPNGGRHLVYRAPEGLNLAPAGPYRGMPGVDTRAGSSWVLWNGDVPDSLDEFAPAPEWLLDEKKVKTADEFEGSLREWFDTLEPGDPSIVVRRAMERINDDMGHSEMVEATYEAIRLGAERHAGVPDLLAALEEAWLARDPGNHTTPEDKWEYKFHEALSTGIQKYGAAIDLIRDLPAYSPAIVPDTIPDSWVTGAPGGKTEFNRLLRKLVEVTPDDMLVLSILWNAPTTRDLARDWGGIEFIYKRVTEQREKSEKTLPSTEPATPKSAVAQVTEMPPAKTPWSLLNQVERDGLPKETFIQRFLEHSDRANGFVQPAYSIPLAWTALSMAFGCRAIIPLGNNGLNTGLWFNIIGFSGTGKSKSTQFGSAVLKTMFKGVGEGYFQVDGGSSIQGWTDVLIGRDGLPTVMLQDEAGGFYKELLNTEWKQSLTHYFANLYEGEIVAPSLMRTPKEIRGKTAKTSFNFFTIATPKATLQSMTQYMFESGFAARMNWIIGPEPFKGKDRFKSKRSSIDSKTGISDDALAIAFDLLCARYSAGQEGSPVQIWGSDAAVARLDSAHERMIELSQNHPKYEDVIEPSITRLFETSWKCSALLALYRGDNEFTLEDATIALSYVEDWFATIIEVSERVANDYERDLKMMTDFVKSRGGKVSRHDLKDHFRGMIVRSGRELDDRIDFLMDSGRLVRTSEQGATYYEVIE